MLQTKYANFNSFCSYKLMVDMLFLTDMHKSGELRQAPCLHLGAEQTGFIRKKYSI